MYVCFITAHHWRNGHFTSVNICGVWGRDGNGAERGRRMGSSSPPRMDFSYPIPAPPRMTGKISCPIPAP